MADPESTGEPTSPTSVSTMPGPPASVSSIQGPPASVSTTQGPPAAAKIAPAGAKPPPDSQRTTAASVHRKSNVAGGRRQSGRETTGIKPPRISKTKLMYQNSYRMEPGVR